MASAFKPQPVVRKKPVDQWSVRERLALGSSVCRSGDQNWVSVSRAIRPFAETGRRSDWFSQKNCALQYADLLEKVETPKRKRSEKGEVIDTPGMQIVRKLTGDRIEELKTQMLQAQQQYKKLKTEIEMVNSGHCDEKLADIWEQIQLRQKEKEEKAAAAQRALDEERRARAAQKGRLQQLHTSGNSADLDDSSTQDSVLSDSVDVEDLTASGLAVGANSATGQQSSLMLAGTTSSVDNKSRDTPPPPPSHLLTTLLQKKTPLDIACLRKEDGSKQDGNESLLGSSSKKMDLQPAQLGVTPSAGAPTLTMLLNTPNSGSSMAASSRAALPVSAHPALGASLAAPVALPAPPHQPPAPGAAVVPHQTTLAPVALPPSALVTLPSIAATEMIATSTKSSTVTPVTIDSSSAEPVLLSSKEDDMTAAATVQASEETFTEVSSAESHSAIEETPASSLEVIPQLETMDESSAQREDANIRKEVEVELEKAAPVEEMDEEMREGDSSEAKGDKLVEVKDENVSEEHEAEPEVVMQLLTVTLPAAGEPVAVAAALSGTAASAAAAATESSDSGPPSPASSHSSAGKPAKTPVSRTRAALATAAEVDAVPGTATPTKGRKRSRATKKATETFKSEDSKIEEKEHPMPVVNVVNVEVAVVATVSSAAASADDANHEREEGAAPGADDGAEESEEAEVTTSSETREDESDEEGVAGEADDRTAPSAADATVTSASSLVALTADTSLKLPAAVSSMESLPCSPSSMLLSDDTEEEKSYKIWRKSITLVWRSVANHKYANVFLHPVTDDIALGYTSCVFRPMDLQTIKKNIENGCIRTTAEFQRDMMLMFTNAIMYNNVDHDVYKMAMEMYDDAMQHIEQFVNTQLMVKEQENKVVSLRGRRETSEKEDEKRRITLEHAEGGKKKRLTRADDDK